MDNINSICFVGRVKSIMPIEGADKIEQAMISGWECVIQKGEFVTGELVVIAVTDAVIPVELAEKLNITKYLKHRKKTSQYSVKITKLRGIYSTATIIQKAQWVDCYEGQDMMKTFNIEKYEEPAVMVQLAGGKKIRYHKNPNFHVYYKFPNAKNVPGMFNEDDEIVITNKIHGTNARYGIVKKNKLSLWDGILKFFGNEWVAYEFVYGSHEMEKGSDSQGFYSSDVWKTVGDNAEIRNRLWNYVKRIGKEHIGEGIILYGEIYGPGIQKYYDYGRNNYGIVFFDIKMNGRYLDLIDIGIVLNVLGLPKIDILYCGKYNEEKIKELQHGRMINSKVPEEGVVVTCTSGSRDKIAKFISNNYLEFQSKKEDSTDFH